MKSLAACFIVLLALSGCASIRDAGNASYTVKPFKSDSGETICCEVEVHNGKEIANLEAHILVKDGTYKVDLIEQGVTAFEGQRIAAGVADEAIKSAASAAAAATLAPLIPLLIPAAGAALASGGIGAAAVGAGAVIVKENVTP